MAWWKRKRYETINQDFWYYKRPSSHILKYTSYPYNKPKKSIFYYDGYSRGAVLKEQYEMFPDDLKKRFRKEEGYIVSGYLSMYKGWFDVSDTLAGAILNHHKRLSEDTELSSVGDYGFGAYALYNIGDSNLKSKYKKSKFPLYPDLYCKEIELIYQGSPFEEPIRNENDMLLGIGRHSGNLRNYVPYLDYKFPQIRFGVHILDLDKKYITGITEDLLTCETYQMQILEDKDDEDSLFSKPYGYRRLRHTYFHKDDLKVITDFNEELNEMRIERRDNKLDDLLAE
jgi:hypothetical protein